MALGVLLAADQAANNSSPRETKVRPSPHETPSAVFLWLLSFFKKKVTEKIFGYFLFLKRK
jgi:hypothetical protein